MDLRATLYEVQPKDGRTWKFEVRDRESNLAMDVEISKQFIFELPDVQYWAGHGNAAEARATAERFAASEAIEVAAPHIAEQARRDPAWSASPGRRTPS